MDKVVVPLSVLRAMQDVVERGQYTPSAASYACGVVFVGIERIIKEAEKNETV